MSTISENGKYLNLDGVRVSYSPKDNTIHLTTTDEDLVSSGFNLTLKAGSPTEDALRELLIEKGLINTEWLPEENFPKTVVYPESTGTNWNEVSLGIDSRNRPVIWDLNSSPHAYICGIPGSGKSVVIQSIIWHAMQHNDEVAIWGVDWKRTEFSTFAQYENTMHKIVNNSQDTLLMLLELDDLLNKRYSEMESAKVNNFKKLENVGLDTRAAIVLIDEAYLVLSKTLEDSPKGQNENRAKAEISRILLKLVSRGQAAGIFLAVSTQRPDPTIFMPEFTDQINMRIAVGRMEPKYSQAVLGSNKATNAIPNGRGVVASDGTEIDTLFFFSSYDWAKKYILTNPKAEPKMFKKFIEGR